MATVVTYLPRAPTGEAETTSRVGRLVAAADKAAHRVGTVRYRFSAVYTEAGSGVDRGVRFDSLKSLIMYLPRAFAIGFWAPFPDTWVGAGRRVGSVGKLLSGAETLVMYVVQLLALVAVLRPPRRLASWLLLAVTAFGVTGLGLVVPNVGALYRFRYTFWVLLIVLGAKGLGHLLASRGRLLRPRGRAAACVALALALAAASACGPNAGQTGARSTARETAAATTNAAAADDRAGKLGFALVNITGTDLRAVYVSPSGSAGWEENVLGGGVLADSDSVELRFSPEEKAAAWDIRIEGADEHFAEWKGLRLGGVSRITLYLDVVGERAAVAERVVVAEVE